jgi:hypothetical protein
MPGNEHQTSGKARRPWRLLGWGTAAALLALPYLAGAPWTASDYVFAAVIFGLVGGFYELAVRMNRSHAYRGGIAVALAAAFLLTWINLAVGIIGNEDNPANLVFFGIILLAAAGAAISGFRPLGMARTMTFVAGVQMLTALVVLIIGLGRAEPPGPFGLFILIAGFAPIWLASAWLFRMAHEQQLGRAE